MAFDKFALLIDLTMHMAQGATADELLDDMVKTFDLVDNMEAEAISRGWIFPDACPKCGGKINIVELGSLTTKMYRVYCDCSDGHGQTKNEAITKWINS